MGPGGGPGIFLDKPPAAQTTAFHTSWLGEVLLPGRFSRIRGAVPGLACGVDPGGGNRTFRRFPPDCRSDAVCDLQLLGGRLAVAAGSIVQTRAQASGRAATC